jgi:hypothetical protein
VKLGRLNHIGIATSPKPLPFRGGVGVGSVGIAQGPRNPTPLRLVRKRTSLAAPPLKGRGEWASSRVTPHAVTPAQAGVHHRWMKFKRQEMDSRLRGNDEFRDLEIAR